MYSPIPQTLRPLSSDNEYVGFIWIANDPVSRLSVWAPSLESALARIVEQYGDGHVIIMYDEADAR